MTRTDSSPVPDYPSLLRQDERGVVVVGAGNGMGRQAAHAFAMVGARLMCVDVDKELAREVAEETGGTAWAGDVRDRNQVRSLFESARRELGGVNVIVNVVGIGQQFSNLLDTEPEVWDSCFDVNLRQCYHVMQEGGRAIIESGGGAMVFVTSIAAVTASPRIAVYGAAKAGLASLVRSAAVELGPHVRVNCVAPANTMTPRLASQISDADKVAYAQGHPVGRLGTTSDQAGVMLFLASDLAGFVTGQTILVDGGLLLQLANPGRLWPGERPT